MPILSNRWDIDYVNQRVYRDYATSPTVTDTSLALYSALQDEFDEPAQMDDTTPMSAQTPTAFTMINGWFIDYAGDSTTQGSTEALTGGAIQTSGWTGNVITAIGYDGSGAGTPFGSADIGRTITGTTTTDSGTILAFDERDGTEQGVVWIRPDDPATDLFDNASEAYTVAASSAAGNFTGTFDAAGSRTGEYLLTNAFALGTLADETDLYVYQGSLGTGSKITAWWSDGFIDILIAVREAGTLIDDGFVSVFARQFNQLFDHFVIDLSAGGRQPVPLSTGGDLLNNPDGHWNQVFTDSAGAFLVGEIITTASNNKRGIVRAVSGTNPTVTIEYTELELQGEILSGDGQVSSEGTGTGTAVNSVAVNQAALGTPPTLVVGATTASLGAGEPTAPYSLAFDTNQNTFSDLYGFFKYICKRDQALADTVGTAFTAQAGSESVAGEAYIGNELQAEYNTQTGAFVEGEQLWFHDSGNALVSTGVVVADHDDGATGDLIMRNMRTYTSNTITQVGDNVAQGSYTDFATVASTRTIPPVKVSPFGTLAGGVIFGAPGVLLTDILSAESQNFQLIDDDGTVRTPPITIQVTVNGLHASANDRVAVFELDNPFASNGQIIKNQYTMTAAAGTENGIGDSNVEADAAITNDTPASGWISVVDDSLAATTGQEYNFKYDSFTGQIFTLTPLTMGGAQTADTLDSTGTNLQDADASFIVNGVEVGMIVRNVTALQGGTGNDWQIGDAYEFNTIPVDFTTSDTAYVPIVLGESLTSIVSGTMTYIGDRDIMIRVRNGGSVSPITPFETGSTLTSANLTITAIRTLDTIAT
jgi:hypothetical protein